MFGIDDRLFFSLLHLRGIHFIQEGQRMEFAPTSLPHTPQGPLRFLCRLIDACKGTHEDLGFLRVYFESFIGQTFFSNIDLAL